MDFGKIENFIKQAKEMSMKIEDAFYESSKALGTWHYGVMDKYKKKGIDRDQALLIIIGRQASNNFTDPLVSYFFRHGIMSDPEIEGL